MESLVGDGLLQCKELVSHLHPWTLQSGVPTLEGVGGELFKIDIQLTKTGFVFRGQKIPNAT